MHCAQDIVTPNNKTFPFCFPVCLDGQSCPSTCTAQIGACCPEGLGWDSATNKCVPLTCGEGYFYCAAQKKCLPGGTSCETTCDNNGTCSGDESCQCPDCVNGGDDDKDKCSVIGGVQALCSDDLPDDNKPGACCIPPKTWSTATNSCVECSNTQAPSEIKADFDQPYISCTGSGVATQTHFRYRITKTSPTNTDAPYVSEPFTIGTQVLHPKMSVGTYSVQCFYGTSAAVDTSSTATPHSCMKTILVRDSSINTVNGCSRIYPYK